MFCCKPLLVVAWFQATFYGRQEKVLGTPAVILRGAERVGIKIRGQPNFLIIEDCSAFGKYASMSYRSISRRHTKKNNQHSKLIIKELILSRIKGGTEFVDCK